MAEGYWQTVGRRAWQEARKAAWGDSFGTAKSFGSPVAAAAAALTMGAAFQSILTGVASAAIVLILWPLIFFAVKFKTVPEAMHAEMRDALDAERAANATKPVDMNNVFGLLDRVQRQCSLLRKGTYDRPANLKFAKELVADITAIHGPDTAHILLLRYGAIIDPESPQMAVQASFRELSSALAQLRERLTADTISKERPDLAGYVRDRLLALRANDEAVLTRTT